jgi:hypothetical protein
LQIGSKHLMRASGDEQVLRDARVETRIRVRASMEAAAYVTQLGP